MKNEDRNRETYTLWESSTDSKVVKLEDFIKQMIKDELRKPKKIVDYALVVVNGDKIDKDTDKSCSQFVDGIKRAIKGGFQPLGQPFMISNEAMAQAVVKYEEDEIQKQCHKHLDCGIGPHPDDIRYVLRTPDFL